MQRREPNAMKLKLQIRRHNVKLTLQGSKAFRCILITVALIVFDPADEPLVEPSRPQGMFATSPASGDQAALPL